VVNQVAQKSENTLRMKVLCKNAPMTTTDAAADQLSCQDADEKDGNTESRDVDVKRYFYLKNCDIRDLVLDVEGMNRSRGTPVILWDQKFSTNHDPGSLVNQLWYEDTATSTVRTALNDFCLDLYGE